jgi:hypothetical protein
MIYCFGDSHISNFAGGKTLIKELTWIKNDLFFVNRLGPYLAYNLVEKIDIFNNEIIKIKDKIDTVLFSFGEIDCRAQVQRQSIIKNKSTDEIVTEIVERYLDFLKIFKKKYNIKNIVVFGVVPCFYENPFQEYYIKHPNDFDCPRGTLNERQSYKRKFNDLTEELCLKNNFYYFSIFEDLIISEQVDKKYWLDEIHLNPSTVFPLILENFRKVDL